MLQPFGRGWKKTKKQTSEKEAQNRTNEYKTK